MTITPSGATVWRLYETDGFPASGPHKPIKTEVIAWSEAVEAEVAAAVAAAASAAAKVMAPQGRLTLQSGVPVMTTTQSAKTTIYYTAYEGGQLPIYDGTNMVPTVITGGEISVATTDTTKNPAAIGASKVNDWFVWNDSGTIRLSHGPDWTNDTTRSAGTALVKVNGIYLNNATITNGPAASRGTYVGTTRSNGSSQLDWIFGAAAAGGTAAFFGVWNMYNRVVVNSQTIDSTASRATTSGTTEPLLNSTSNRTSYVCGLAEDSFLGKAFGSTNTTGTALGVVGIGYDSTSAINYGLTAPGSNTTTASGTYGEYSTTSLGFHFMQALQFAANGNNITVYGSGTATGISTGTSWQGRM